MSIRSMPRLPALALFLACASSTLPAQAQLTSVSATMTVSQYKFELIDLDLSDNITPAISFTESVAATSWHSFAHRYTDLDELIGPGSTSVSGITGSASTLATMDHWSSSTQVRTGADEYHQFGSGAGYTMLFDLTPMTGIRFSAVATYDITMGEDPTIFKLSQAIMSGYMDYIPGGIYETIFENGVGAFEGKQTGSISGYMETGTLALQGRLSLHAISYSIAEATPVPEPATYAMLLAGLGVLTATSRRVRQRHA